MKRIILFLGFLFTLVACEAVFVGDISDRRVILLAPSNNTEVLEGEINFHWESVEDATRYKLRIATPSFENASQIVQDTVLTPTSFTQKLSLGMYEWQVRALNDEYQTDYTTNSFSVNQ